MTSTLSAPTRPLNGPSIRLEVRLGNHRPSLYEVGDAGFLVGSVPGCDLRLPGTNLAPVICLIARHPHGASLRKLAPVQPITVNGRTVTSAPLVDGDRIAIGALELTVTITGSPEAPPSVRPAVRGVSEQEQAQWAKQKQALESEIARQRVQLDGLLRQSQQEDGVLAQREQALRAGQEELGRKVQELEARAVELAAQSEEVGRTRRQLNKLRQEFAARARDRRDKVLTQQQAIRRAARKVQQRKQTIDAEEKALRLGQQQYRQDIEELQARAEQLARERSLVEEQYGLLTSRQQEHQREMAQRQVDIHERERRLAEEMAALEKGQKQHKDDLVRLDRIQASIDARQRQLEQRALEVDRRFEQLQRDARELEEQAVQMDEWHEGLRSEAERLEVQKREQQEAISQLSKRGEALETQQTMLATLRTRVEKMRDELREQEQALSDQRAMVAASEEDLNTRREAAERLYADATAERELLKLERAELEQQRQRHEEAVVHWRESQASFADELALLEQRQAELDTQAAEQSAQADLLLVRGQQIDELHQRLISERQAIQEREAGLSRAEQTLKTLQEQVRRRSEDINARQHKLEQDEANLRQRLEQSETHLQHSEAEHQQAIRELEELRQELTAHAEAVEKRRQELEALEKQQAQARRRLEEETEALAAQQHAVASERLSWDVERQAAQEEDRRRREETTALYEQLRDLVGRLPELELQANATLARMEQARAQLREHLTEVHGYARQGRDELEAGRRQLQTESERVRQQELELQVARDEHRLQVAAFRQQLAEWQGKLGEARQSLQQGSTQLELQKAEVEQRAKQAAETKARLASEAAELEREKQQVVARRGQMDRHLLDMREWYRKKLRDLAGVDLQPGEGPGEGDLVPLPSREALPGLTGDRSPARAVLTQAEEVAPMDRQLGELLQSLGLVDGDTLNVLWADARRQRRSLRQLMLANGYLTLYQMALIEAGNLDGLVLGPVRVIDKLPSTPRESVFHVFDPRRGVDCTLRHLAEAEMQDAVRPGEFRERFQAALAVQHANVAGVLEVMELQGRPAVLTEWISGLSSSDWPGFAAAPGVWYRLVCQAVLGLSAVHDQGLIHGHLSSSTFVLLGDGTLKLTGVGEPPWLTTTEVEESIEGDVRLLGKVAANWAATPPGGKASKPKPLPEELQGVVDRLNSGAYGSLHDLVADLEEVGQKIPASNAAWERLLKHAGDVAVPASPRKSA